MELQAASSQLHIVNGLRQTTPAVPGILYQTAPGGMARSKSHEVLLAHLSLTGPLESAAVLAQDLLDALSNRFFKTPGSVTAALRTAVLEVNQLLLRYNLSGVTTKQEGAITCAVMRGSELFTTQAGEATALLGHNFGVERLPPQRPETVTPIGRTAGLDLRFYHHRLQPGDMLLLADPGLAHLPAHTLSPALVDNTVEEGLERLVRLVGQGTARLLLVEFTDEVVEPAAMMTTPTRSGRRLPIPADGRQPQRATTAMEGSPAGRPLPKAAEVEATARQATAGAALGLSKGASWLAQFLARLRPPTEATEEARPGTIAPLLLAILIPLIVALVVTSVYFERGRVASLSQIKQGINNALAIAQQPGQTPDVARQQYNEILRLAAEADGLRPGDSDVQRARQEAITNLDWLDGVTRLVARPFYPYPTDTQLGAVALRGGFNGGVFTLDWATGKVYRHDTDESYVNPVTSDPAVVAFNNQAVGTHIVGQLIDLMWRPKGTATSRDGLAMLDSRGALITFYPSFEDIRAVPLPLASDWRQPVAVATYDERLYVLDVEAEQIWRYFPEGEGFTANDAQRSLAFEGDADLDQVVDFTIYTEDGSVILLYQDGRLRRYVGGRQLWGEVELAENGLLSPLIAPTAVEIVGQGLNSSIFILDPGSGRIVQLSLGGTFLAQYKAQLDTGQELFAAATDLGVIENPLRIFATAGNILYLTTQE